MRHEPSTAIGFGRRAASSAVMVLDLTMGNLAKCWKAKVRFNAKMEAETLSPAVIGDQIQSVNKAIEARNVETYVDALKFHSWLRYGVQAGGMERGLPMAAERRVNMRIPPTYRRYRAGLLVPVIGLILAACQNPQPIMPGGSVPPPNVAIITQKTPPAAQPEPIPSPPPGPASYFAWDPGHWHWYETQFVWIPGHYVEQPYQGSSWTHGNWSYDGNLNWTWTPGYWH